MWNRVDKAVGGVSVVFAVVGAGIIGLLAVLVVLDVIGRQIGTPVRGVVEIAAMVVVGSAFLTIPYVLRRGSHIRATVIVDRLPKKARIVAEVVAYAIGLTVFALLAYSSFGEFTKAYLAGSYEGEGALRVPTWPARLTIFLSSLLMVAESVLGIVKALRGETDD
jgi:TRAP-type C4-dicarboxylate transport system permease small subunit